MKTRSETTLHPIGIGTYKMGGEREAIYDEELDQNHIEAISYSIENGQNHIDTAEMYGNGHTDEIVGMAISSFKRENLFIANKLWESSFGDTQTIEAVQAMCSRLGTDYIDLLYIHSTFGTDKWKMSLEPIKALIDSGTVRYFGVSNFTVSDMVQVKQHLDLDISTNQVEYNVTNKQLVDNDFNIYCDENNIKIVAYKPIDRGAVANHEIVVEIADKYNATPQQIALAWLLEKDALVIPKASQKHHIDENLASLDIKLSDDDIAKLDNVE